MICPIYSKLELFIYTVIMAILINGYGQNMELLVKDKKTERKEKCMKVKN